MTAASSYLVLVPPGWIRIPGGAVTKQSLDSVVRQVAAVQGDDTGWVQSFGSAMERAAAADPDFLVLDSYVPPGAIPGTQVVCSVVFGTVPIDNPDGRDLDELLLDQLGRRRGTIAEINGCAAIRWVTPADELGAEAAVDGARAISRVHYLGRIPGLDDRLISIVLSVATPLVTTEVAILEAEQVLADSLAALFDAMVTTVRWRNKAGKVIEYRRSGVLKVEDDSEEVSP